MSAGTSTGNVVNAPEDVVQRVVRGSGYRANANVGDGKRVDERLVGAESAPNGDGIVEREVPAAGELGLRGRSVKHASGLFVKIRTRFWISVRV